MQTKTVQGYFKPQQVTKEEFVKRWTGHFTEFYHLANNSDEYAELKKMQARLDELAGNTWERIPS